MRNKIWAALLCLHCVGLVAMAQNAGKRPLVLQVSNGGFVAFSSETSSADRPNADLRTLPAALNSQALAGEGRIIHRVLTDSEGRVIFGYDLWIESDPSSKKFNFAVLPSDQAFRNRFLKESARHQGDAVFATFPKSSAKQSLDDGDAVSLELLVNREAGVKIIDVVKVTFDRSSFRESAPEAPPKDFTLDAVVLAIKSYQLLIDGDLVAHGRSTVKCAGSLLWFYVPDGGRFIFSLVPREGYPFQKIGVLDGNRIEFTMNGKQYEWFSGDAILPNGGTWNLWVLQDPKYTPLFALDKPIAKKEPNALQKLNDAVGITEGRAGLTFRKPSRTPTQDDRSKNIRAPRVMIGGADSMENLLPNSP